MSNYSNPTLPSTLIFPLETKRMEYIMELDSRMEKAELKIWHLEDRVDALEKAN